MLTDDGFHLKQSLQHDLFIDQNKIDIKNQLSELKQNSQYLDDQMRVISSGEITDIERRLLDVLQSKQDDIDVNIYQIEKRL